MPKSRPMRAFQLRLETKTNRRLADGSARSRK